MRDLASICLEHAIPKSDVAGSVSVLLRRSVKYENSSVDLTRGKIVSVSPKEDGKNPRQQGVSFVHMRSI